MANFSAPEQMSYVVHKSKQTIKKQVVVLVAPNNLVLPFLRLISHLTNCDLSFRGFVIYYFCYLVLHLFTSLLCLFTDILLLLHHRSHVFLLVLLLSVVF